MADSRLFQVVHVNIRGIRSNKVNLQHYLEQHHFPDIVTINESKLNVNQPFLLPYYDCVASRGSCPYGSIILKRKDILDVSVIEDFNQFNEEILGVRINGNSFRPTINIVTYYNPPNTSVNPRIIQAVKHLKGRTLLTGDFNCKNICWGSTRNDSQGEALLKELNDALFLIMNDGTKTRCNPISGKEETLDLIVSNSNMYRDFVAWTVDEDVGSDHYPIRATFNIDNTCLRMTQTYRNIKDTNWDEFRQSLTQPPSLLPTNAEEIDEAVQHLTLLITNAFEAACPEKCNRFPNKKTFTPEMICTVKEKRKLRRQKSDAKACGDMARVCLLQRDINRKNNDLKRKTENQAKRTHYESVSRAK